jgi:hypothetical protein
VQSNRFRDVASDSNGRVARVAHPAGFGVELPFNCLLWRTTDRLVVAGGCHSGEVPESCPSPIRDFPASGFGERCEPLFPA